MDFNFIIGNPPYDGRNFLYLKILNEAWNHTNCIAWLCPTTFVDDVYKRSNIYNAIIRKFQKFLLGFEDITSDSFNIDIARDLLGIFYFSDNTNKTVAVDMYNLAWRKYKESDKIKCICEKLLNYCNRNSLRSILLVPEPKKMVINKIEPNPAFECNPNKWYIGTSLVRGDIGTFTWLNLLCKNDKPLKGELRDAWYHIWSFDTEQEANDFCDYLNNSVILKFAIFMEKKNQTNNRSDFEYFPNTNTLPFNDSDLAKEIGLSKDDLDLMYLSYHAQYI